MESFCRHFGLQPGRSIDQLNPLLLKFIRNRSENRARIFFLEPQQQPQPAEVRAHVEQVLGRDLPGHYAMPNTALFKRIDELGKLSDFDPVSLVSERFDLRTGFVREGDSHNLLYALSARLSRNHQGQGLAPGNNS